MICTWCGKVVGTRLGECNEYRKHTRQQLDACEVTHLVPQGETVIDNDRLEKAVHHATTALQILAGHVGMTYDQRRRKPSPEEFAKQALVGLRHIMEQGPKP